MFRGLLASAACHLLAVGHRLDRPGHALGPAATVPLDVMISATPAIAVDGERRSRLAPALELRGGAWKKADVQEKVDALGAMAGLLLLDDKVEELFERSPLAASARGVLVTWMVFDKIMRILKAAEPTRILYARDDHLLMAAALDLHAIEAMQGAITVVGFPQEDAEHVVEQLKTDFSQRIRESADYALQLDSKSLPSGLRQGETLRVADSAECDMKSCRAVGQYVDLADDALAQAADLDVSGALVERANSSLSVLGLIAALGHESVFQEVQRRLQPEASARVMTIAEFKRRKGVAGVVDLLKWLVNEYQPGPLHAVHLALYHAVMRGVHPEYRDPTFFQFAWGLCLGSHVAKPFADKSRAAWLVKHSGKAFRVLEATWRLKQLAVLYDRSFANFGLSAFEHLLVANAALTLTMFFRDATGEFETLLCESERARTGFCRLLAQLQSRGMLF